MCDLRFMACSARIGMPIARLGIHCSDLPAIIWRCGAGLVEDGGDEFEFEEVAAALTPSMGSSPSRCPR